MNIPANIIAFLHLLVIIFVTSVPFATDDPFLLLYYCFIVFFIMIHWHYNNDTCVLTLIESSLRGKKHKDTFMGKLIRPVYNVSSTEIQIITLFLFTFAFLKTRYWEKDRFDYVLNLIVDKVTILYDKLTKL